MIPLLRHRSAKAGIVLAMLGSAVYYNALDNPFHYDDHHSIEYNPHIRSLAHIGDFFLDPHTFSSRESGYMFRPLLLTSYALNYTLEGQRVRGYRLVNFLLHLACTLLVYLLARNATRADLAAVLAALAFLLHPLHAEVINYISSRSDLLVSFFLLAAFALVLRGAGRISAPVYGAFIGALLSKSVALIFPGVVLLFEVRLRGWKALRRRARQYWPLLGIAALYLGVLWANRFIASSLAKAPRAFDVQLWTQLKAFVYYIWLFCLPVHLNVEHQFFSASTFFDPAVMAAFLFLASLALGVLRLRRVAPLLGLAFSFIALLPASLMPLNILVSERRAYLAIAGLIFAALWVWGHFASRKRAAAATTAALVCGVYALLCLERNAVWSSPSRLWADAVEKAPHMYRARFNLALALKEEGRKEEALRQLEEGLRLNPSYGEAWVLMGNMRRESGRSAAAEQAYVKALAINPRLEGVYHNLGNIYMQRSRPDKAAYYYRQTLERNPHFAEARNNLGQAYEALGRRREALREYERAIADSLYWINTEDPIGGAWFNLARAAEQLGEYERARAAYERAYLLLRGRRSYADFARRAQEGMARVQEAPE